MSIDHQVHHNNVACQLPVCAGHTDLFCVITNILVTFFLVFCFCVFFVVVVLIALFICFHCEQYRKLLN